MQSLNDIWRGLTQQIQALPKTSTEENAAIGSLCKIHAEGWMGVTRRVLNTEDADSVQRFLEKNILIATTSSPRQALLELAYNLYVDRLPNRPNNNAEDLTGESFDEALMWTGIINDRSKFACLNDAFEMSVGIIPTVYALLERRDLRGDQQIKSFHDSHFTSLRL